MSAKARSSLPSSALDRAALEIRRGSTVGIFAEGTRTEDGCVQPLKRGFVHVLRQSGADLLPVYVRGTFTLKPKGTLLIDPRERIGAELGAAVPHAELVAQSDEEIMAGVRSILQRMGDGRHGEI